ncbi:MAG TPA: DNA mismatch repair endonuclease MutL [Gemmatimonadales bacterium]
MSTAARPRIRVLPDAVADQIAAGEVVERPASAVKELVENALDAGATTVRVAVESGGKTLIEIGDDGGGMPREDAILAIERHATSKISAASDLVGIATFGFRGEALPAIASVSRFEMVTAAADGSGTRIAVTGGRVDAVTDAVRRRGTTVTVRGLFFNTPARRKFLRSVGSETRATWEAVATLALAHPEVGFEFVADGQERLRVPAHQSRADRLAAVWGRDLAGTLIPVRYAAGGFAVEGFAQRPGDARPTGRRVQLFVNGRPFRDPFLVRAAEAGYRSALHPGDRPSLFLDLQVDPAEVDVNVHPAKLEVRFRDRIGAERTVEEAVRHALGGLAAAAPLGEWRPMPDAAVASPRGAPGGDLAGPGLTDLFGESERTEGPRPSPGEVTPFAAAVWQLFDSYIVFQSPEGLVMVDQHSAHERVLYEEAMGLLAQGGATSQRLLLPLTIALNDEELEAVERHRDLLERVGYEVAPFGGRTVIVHAVPAPHPRFDAEACFRELVADLAGGRFAAWANGLERFAATFACRAAIKAGTPLQEPEMRRLLHRLFSTALPAHDVHGRATIVQLPREELERRFGRR